MQLSSHRLRGIFVPSLEQEARRNVSRLRTNFWKLRQQVGAKLKSLLFTQGLIEGDDNIRLCKKWITQKLLEIENYPEHFYYTTQCATLLCCNGIELERIDSEEAIGMSKDFASDFS